MGGETRLRMMALLLGGLGAFLVGELSLRAYQKVAADVPFFSLLPGYHEKTFALSPFLVFGPRIDWQIPDKEHPETAFWNTQGFRTHETLGAKPPGEIRIVALGGSTTEDVWNEAGIHWPLVAERTLHAGGRPDVKVYNGAMSAYTSAHSLSRLSTDVVQYQPDFVLVMHNINDLLVAYSAASQGKPIDSSYRVKYARKSLTGTIDDSDVVLSRLVAFVRGRLARLVPDEPRKRLAPVDLDPALAIFERNLRSIAAVARAHGARPVFVTMPIARSRERFDDVERLARGSILDDFPLHERFLQDFDAYNARTRAVGAALGVPVIDAAQTVPSDDRLFADLVHTTTAGVEVMGAAVAEGLRPLLPTPTDATVRPTP